MRNILYLIDEYELSIKTESDMRFVRFMRADANVTPNVTIAGENVTLCLSPEYLTANGCFALNMNQNYSFSLRIRKHAQNLLDQSRISTVYHASKESRAQTFMPVAYWKQAPVILDAAQTADGQITIQWSHHPGNNDTCAYRVMRISKALGIKTSEELVATVSSTSVIIDDLLDGEYSYIIVPSKDNELGTPSTEATVTIQNAWKAAPNLTLSQIQGTDVQLDWPTEKGVEAYHIRISIGDNNSLLQFVVTDYKLYQEYDIPATGEAMQMVFSYPDAIDPEKGLKVKVEIWGVRHTADDTAQASDMATATITVMP